MKNQQFWKVNEVKTAPKLLGRNKSLGVDGIPIMPFQTTKTKFIEKNLKKNMPINMENKTMSHRLEGSIYITVPEKGDAKECSNYKTIALIFPSKQNDVEDFSYKAFYHIWSKEWQIFKLESEQEEAVVVTSETYICY